MHPKNKIYCNLEMDKRNEWAYNSLKRTCFSKINEKVQSKYNAMQQKLEKSRSFDSLSFKENDAFISEKHSNKNISESAEFLNVQEEINYIQYDQQSCVIENVSRTTDAKIEYYDYEEVNLSDSETESTLNENQESNGIITNKFFGNAFSKTSLESLNEVTGESDGDLTPSTPTPSPKISIRNKIGSRITAAREKRRVKKLRSVAKDKKKEYSDKVEKLFLTNTTKQDVRVFKRSRIATVTVALIEVTGLENENPDEKPRTLFCRFRVGNEKYKSKVIRSPATSNHSKYKWEELFNFNMYEENNLLEISLWDKDVLVGRSFVDLYEVDKEKTHRMRITLEGEAKNVQIFILLTISGLSILNTLVDFDDYQKTQRQLSDVRKKFAWYNVKNIRGELGWLSVIVYGAKGLGGNDCYCILELDNERRQTYTESKTNEPNWMKIFNFSLTDISSILEVTVHDEKKSEDVGKVSIPLLSVNICEKKWYALKDASQRARARGNNPRILLELYITWNLPKAAIKVLNPKEGKLLGQEDKLHRHIFTRNLSRAKAVITWVYNAFLVIKTCFEWESRSLNVIALLCWLLFCWFFKMWMLPLLLLIPFVIYRPHKHFYIRWNELIKGSDIEDTNKKEEKNTSMRQKIQSFQEMLLSVQHFIGKLASLGESVKNLFNFTVPFISCLAIFFITVIAFVMYVVPTKYIFMIWGVHKFTRKILRPNRVPNNEILDLLSRVPDDETLLNLEQLPLENVPEEDIINS